MPRRKTTPGQKQSITKNAKKNFKIWNEQREDKTVNFKQCKGKKYWFISDADPGTVVSFYKSEQPKYLHIETNKDGYHYVVTKEDGKTKTHYIHKLQAEVFEVYAYGKAKKDKSKKRSQVHHMEADKRNEPGSLEILDTNAHKKLFDKRNIPELHASESEHYEYEQRVLKVVEENTPEQAVVVFNGTGVADGKDTKDLTQAIYADDYPGVTDLVNETLDFANTLKGTYALYVPCSENDRELFEKLVLTPGEMEKLNKWTLERYKDFGIKDFVLVYKGIELQTKIIVN